jgi:ABC-2 type transport system permease protein
MAVNADSTTPREALLPASTGLRRTAAGGWSTGFGSIFGKELGDWFRGKRWLVQAVTWTAILNGTVALLMFLLPIIERLGREAAVAQGEVPPPVKAGDPLAIGFSTFFSLAAIAGSIGVIILTQDEIVGERQLGTVAWILSKPVSRTAFLLSKLAANAAGILLFALALPAAITYLEVSVAAGKLIDAVPFLAALPLVAVTLLFYLCLSLMLGVLFTQRGPMLSILFGVLLGGTAVAGAVPLIARLLPVNLADSGGAIAAGAPFPTELLQTMAITLIWCAIFVGVAVRQFHRQEL